MSCFAPSTMGAPGGHNSVSPPAPRFAHTQQRPQAVSGPALAASGYPPPPYTGNGSVVLPTPPPSARMPGQPQYAGHPSSMPLTARPTVVGAQGSLQAEVARREAAEARVQELEALVARLRKRVADLEGKRPESKGRPQARRSGAATAPEPEEEQVEDSIDTAIRTYLEHNPDFPVSIQKVAPNFYVFGDRGTVYVQQRGEHVVVRVGGGYKSLQVFMDERALMVTRDNAAAVRRQQEAASRRA